MMFCHQTGAGGPITGWAYKWEGLNLDFTVVVVKQDMQEQEINSLLKTREIASELLL